MCNLEWEMMKKYASIGERRMNFETTANNQYSAYLEVRRLLVVKRTEDLEYIKKAKNIDKV